MYCQSKPFAAGETSRSAMEKELATKRTGHITKVSEALWAMMEYEDDTYTVADYLTVLDKTATLNSEFMAVELLMENGDMASAMARTTNIPAVVPMNKKTQREYDAFATWMNLLQTMHTAGRAWGNMSASDLAEVESVAYLFDTYAGVQAMSVLNDQTDADYFVPPAFGKNGALRRANAPLPAASEFIDVYPNPADYMVNLQLKQPLPTVQNCTLVITDMLGREVSRQTVLPTQLQYLVNTKDWETGLYLFEIAIPNLEYSINGKFEVMH